VGKPIKKLIPTLLGVCLTTEMAYANSIAPILPLFSILGWIALPIIIGIEGFLFRRSNVSEPFRLATYANLVSSLAGLPLAIVTAPLMIPPFPLGSEVKLMIEKGNLKGGSILVAMGLMGLVMGFAINLWISTRVEHWVASKNMRWKNLALSKKLFIEVNLRTYVLISLFFLYDLFEMLFLILLANSHNGK